MEEIKKEIIDLFIKFSDIVYSRGSCGELGDSFKALDSEYFYEVVTEIYEKHIKHLQHYRDVTFALYHTDKKPDNIFELVMNDIDGEPCLSAIDYEYYKKMFDTKLQKLMYTF